MVKGVFLSAAILILTVSGASAEPVGRWYSGFGQGTTEYGFKKDPDGNNEFYLACDDEGPNLSLTVNGKSPASESIATISIGQGRYELKTNDSGQFVVKSAADEDVFQDLWSGILTGKAMKVTLASGESTIFPLKGARKFFGKDDKERCKASPDD